MDARLRRTETYALQSVDALLALADEHVRLADTLAALAERLLRPREARPVHPGHAGAASLRTSSVG